MSHLLFEQIENAGFLRNNKLNASQIERLSVASIIDFALQSLEVTSVKEVTKEKSIFSHCASFSLGGSRWPCSTLECRLARIEELAQFAALYSDRVYIYNFLGDYTLHPQEGRTSIDLRLSELQKIFAEDLIVLNHLRPLIEAGIIIPISPPNYCPHCLAPRSLGKEYEKRLRRAFERLVHRYNKEVSMSLEQLGDFYVCSAKGPEILLEHGSSSVISNEPLGNLNQMPRIMAQVQSGREVALSKTARKRLGLDYLFANPFYRNAKFELATSQCMKSSLLSERLLDIEFLEDLSEDASLARRNQIIQNHLTCLVPFLEGIEVSDLVKLRTQEEEVFVLFRRALTKAIDEQKAEKKHFSERHAQELYHDVIQPQLSSIDAKLKAAHRKVSKGTRRKIVGWTAAISFGFYVGLLPTGLAAAAAALGLTKVLAEFLEGLMDKSDLEETIRTHEMYFLWKARKVARSR